MKRVLYINELLLCVVSFAFTSLNLFKYYGRDFMLFLISSLVYGVSAALLTIFLIRDLRAKNGRTSAKEILFGSVFALPLFLIVWFNIPNSGLFPLLILSILLATIIILAAIWFRGSSKYVLIGIFVVLSVLMFGTYLFCTADRVNNGHMGEYLKSYSYKLERFIGSNGWAALLNTIPTMIAFLLAGKFCDKMSRENV
ncbi:hypothetical protein [uncultured Ruminococcus sp.]|uniref:hypothetical protein n=1 Tax=uncultured Ruminococcus sp. TaxID=165186 RepID=UPI000EBFA7BA|nr:hypothetical protein [uncultured Ruminococcus sp.]HCJ41171.1 hypothetical protein [Ruminococcus sp.]